MDFTPSTGVRSFIAIGRPANKPLSSSGFCISLLASDFARGKHRVGRALTSVSISLIRFSSALRQCYCAKSLKFVGKGEKYWKLTLLKKWQIN